MVTPRTFPAPTKEELVLKRRVEENSDAVTLKSFILYTYFVWYLVAFEEVRLVLFVSINYQTSSVEESVDV